jgi:hypothetical protein
VLVLGRGLGCTETPVTGPGTNTGSCFGAGSAGPAVDSLGSSSPGVVLTGLLLMLNVVESVVLVR